MNTWDSYNYSEIYPGSTRSDRLWMGIFYITLSLLFIKFYIKIKNPKLFPLMIFHMLIIGRTIFMLLHNKSIEYQTLEVIEIIACNLLFGIICNISYVHDFAVSIIMNGIFVLSIVAAALTIIFSTKIQYRFMVHLPELILIHISIPLIIIHIIKDTKENNLYDNSISTCVIQKRAADITVILLLSISMVFEYIALFGPVEIYFWFQEFIFTIQIIIILFSYNNFLAHGKNNNVVAVVPSVVAVVVPREA